jgi:hypothetical protein
LFFNDKMSTKMYCTHKSGKKKRPDFIFSMHKKIRQKKRPDFIFSMQKKKVTKKKT